MATLIGPSIKVIKACQGQASAIPSSVFQDAHYPGTHTPEHALNQKLVDKGRVAAALENGWRLQVSAYWSALELAFSPQPHPELIALFS